ncbi:nucleoside/nucleotide kinase family protein [Leifsonia shinshuensis]|uniref:Pantothenate kinase n=1 Tax=Leifsonia shinshuensis TaxID=150026 RepID=A0A853CTA4_9MICO|nr:nucleoside/nucleotide kinase family protein [Leifsonia shinshuensis]NYJ21845.1 pantothenate kinase [Leifsonia shinshuensis]
MQPEIPPPDVDALARRALDLVPAGAGRAIVGIAGSPGSGKTTLARAVVDAVNERAGMPIAAYLPMDGFHLADATLEALGRHDRKGAIDTFDGWGFVALLERVLAEQDHPVYAPAFDRSVGEPIAGSLAVLPETRLVVVEGNYLLAPTEPWGRLRPLLAETWFVATPEEERLRRLVDRHTRHGRTPDAARAWAHDVDGANARLIEPTAASATLIVDGGLPVGAA